MISGYPHMMTCEGVYLISEKIPVFCTLKRQKIPVFVRAPVLATLMRQARVSVSDDWDKLETAHRVRGGFELLTQYSEAVDGI